MDIPFVDLKAQYQTIKHEVDKAVSSVIADAAFVNGRYVKEFEDDFARSAGVKYCVSVGNGTDALFIALKALGVSSGDEVITAANSFIATSEAVSMAGARVVFVDIHPETYTIDVSKIKEKITARTKAIIPVHLYGHPADMGPILEIAKKYNLFVVEDAAQAHLAEYNGQIAGSMGDAACFSFFPGKNLGAYGDAGAIVTNNEAIADKARMIANHGCISKYDHEFEGVNSRMDGIQGAVLSVKLKHLPEWTENRRKAASIYNKLLMDKKDIIIPGEENYAKHVYHLYVIRSRKRNALQAYLKQKGIATGIHYPVALPNLPAYKYLGHKRSDFPVSSAYEEEILSLPIYPEISEEHIKYISDRIGEDK